MAWLKLIADEVVGVEPEDGYIWSSLPLAGGVAVTEESVWSSLPLAGGVAVTEESGCSSLG